MEPKETEQLPNGAEYTLKVPLNKDKTEYATFYLKEMKEDVFMAAKSLIDKGKDFDAVRMIIKDLRVGGDMVDKIKDNFVAMNSAARMVLQLIQPVEGELKKN